MSVRLDRDEQKSKVSLGPRLEITTPILVASGTYGVGDKWPEGYAEAGAFVAKTVTPEPRPGNAPPRIVETPSGIINRVGLQNPGIDGFIEKMRGKRFPAPFIASVHAVSAKEVAMMLERLFELDYIVGYELNLSCPNVAHSSVLPAVDFDLVTAILKQARSMTESWLCAKLPPYTCIEAAPACEAAGADALCVSNTYPAMAYNPRGERLQGGLSGPAVKPMTLYNVFQTAKRVAVPIIASGGICNGQDVAEMLDCGARAVQIGSINFVDPGAVSRITAEWRALSQAEAKR